jgi:hypothetical protein
MRKITMTLAAAIFVVGSMAGRQRADTGRFEPQCAGAECDHHPQGSVRRRVGPLVPAGPSSGLRPISLLVRSLLVSRAPIGEFADEAARGRPLFLCRRCEPTGRARSGRPDGKLRETIRPSVRA